jgi:hypothetical protein
MVAGDIKGLAEPSLVQSIPQQPTDFDDGLLTAKRSRAAETQRRLGGALGMQYHSHGDILCVLPDFPRTGSVEYRRRRLNRLAFYAGLEMPNTSIARLTSPTLAPSALATARVDVQAMRWALIPSLSIAATSGKPHRDQRSHSRMLNLNQRDRDRSIAMLNPQKGRLLAR